MPICLFVNLPNYITLTRILSIPVLIWILCSSRFSSANGERELLACFVFIVASLTDAIDGYLARRRAQVTTMGMLLDPVADKLLIAAAFVTLVQFNPRIVPAWMAVIIIGREFLVSGLRIHRRFGRLHHTGQRSGQAEDVCPDLHRRGRDH